MKKKFPFIFLGSRKQELQNAERIYVKECSDALKDLMNQVTDRQLYKKIEKAYDLIHSSQIKSNDQAMENEIEVMRLIRVLERHVKNQDAEEINKVVDKILVVAERRNQNLRSSM